MRWFTRLMADGLAVVRLFTLCGEFVVTAGLCVVWSLFLVLLVRSGFICLGGLCLCCFVCVGFV